MKTEDMVLNKGNKSFLERHQDLFALLLLISAAVFLFIRAPYGFGFWDETWYLTFGHRFVLGDSMLTDEWNVIQLFSFFLYLPVKLYISVIGSTDGIILAARYLYILFACSGTVAIYLLTRRYGPVSILVSAIAVLFVPATMMAVSYYSIVSFFSAILGLLLVRDQKNNATWVAIGLLFAGLVLSNPFLALAYFVYSATVVGVLWYQKRGGTTPVGLKEYVSVKSWFWVTAGIGCVALVFFAFLFSGTTLREIAANLPFILEDSDYNVAGAYGEGQNIFDLKQSVLDFIRINPYIWAAYAMLLAAVSADKRRLLHRVPYLVAAGVITLAFGLYLILKADLYSYLLCMLPPAVLGLFVYVLSQNKNKKVFFCLWVWGFVVAFFQDVASNQGIRLMSFGLFSSVIACVILAQNLICELKAEKSKKNRHGQLKSNTNAAKRAAIYTLLAVLIAQGGFQLRILTDTEATSAEYFYRALMGMPSVSEKLEVAIRQGPAKGLITTNGAAGIYDDMLSDLAVIKSKGNGPFLILGRLPWGYLYVGNPYSTYTTAYLFWKQPETMVRLSKYLELHPEKKPEYIYVPKHINPFVPQELLEEHFEGLNYAQEALTLIREVYACEIVQGKAGYIVTVLD